MGKLTLYAFNNEGIRVLVTAGFNERNQLEVEGYDIGRTVERLTGKSDYEYSYTVDWGEVKKMAGLFGVDHEDQQVILNEIKRRFGGNSVYSALGNFMDENHIEYKGFTW